MASEQNVLATITQMIQGLREEKEKEKLLKEERRVLKEEEKEKRRVLKEEEKEKEKLLREEEKEKEKLLREEEKEKERLLKEKRRVLKEEEKEKEKLLREEEKEKRRVLKEEEKEKLLREEEKEKERLLKEKRRVLKEEEKEKEKLLREEEKEKERLLKEKRRVLKEKEKEEERLLRQQEREEFHQKVTNMEIRFQSEIGGFEADVKRLCHLAYPGAPIDFVDQLAAQTLIDAIRDVEAQRVLRLAFFDKSREALVRALEVEAAYRTHELVGTKIRMAGHRMRTRYYQRANHDGFGQNDLVWLFHPKRKKGLSPELMALWKGPYKIIKRINDLVYRIQQSSKSKAKVVHLGRLACYQGDRTNWT
ncbi:hypothetical protein LAZ67_2005303 [Cordylochernes scorpioides]|uniref:Integrase p58-like C-terminal domain-containing protein n=1 Tax=Cordylochernes scorpioides TaxID=51811 RepID=A0ABY6K519_9ARAC|nr:hypothetical protein LAZ67_2005303 [Cordylochernes scorpioides]